MRTVSREALADRKDWEKLGWTRAPRNGHEKQMVRDGKPQPKATEGLPTKYRVCKKHGRTLFKCDYHFDARRGKSYERWYCFKCKLADNKRWRLAHPKESKRQRDEYQKRIKEQQADFIDGLATVQAGWVLKHQADIAEAVKEGKHFIVEYLGEPAYAIGPVEG